MIIKGSNLPLVLSQDDINFTACSSIEVSLYHDDYGEVKHWSKTGIEVTSNVLSCPLTQQETMGFPVDYERHREKYYVECKAMLDGQTRHFRTECVPVQWREDGTVMT